MGEYKVRAPAFIDGVLFPAGAIVETDGIPGKGWEPVGDGPHRQWEPPAPIPSGESHVERDAAAWNAKNGDHPPHPPLIKPLRGLNGDEAARDRAEAAEGRAGELEATVARLGEENAVLREAIDESRAAIEAKDKTLAENAETIAEMSKPWWKPGK